MQFESVRSGGIRLAQAPVLAIIIAVQVLIGGLWSFGCSNESSNNLSIESAAYWQDASEELIRTVGWLRVKIEGLEAEIGALLCAYETSPQRGSHIVRVIAGLQRQYLPSDYSRAPKTFDEETRWTSYAAEVKGLRYEECSN